MLALLALQLTACGRIGYDVFESTAADEDAAVDATVNNTWWDTAFQSRLRLRFDTSSLSTPLSNVVLPVRITPDVFTYAEAQPDGADLRFVDADGLTDLPYEIDTWDPGGESLVWVRIPELAPAGSSDHIWLYFNNSAAAAPQRVAEVWSDFHAVWHLGESATGSLDEIKDSSGGGHHGQGGDGIAQQVPAPIASPLGRGQSFDGVDDLLVVPDTTTFIFAEPALTVEAWVYFGPLDVEIQCYFSKAGYSAGYRMCYARNGRMIFQITGEDYTLYSDSFPTPEAWHYVVNVWDGTRMQTYIDGVADSASMDRPGLIDSSTKHIALGHGTTNTGDAVSYPMNGNLDEIRVSNVARSADWVLAQYLAAQGTMSSFELQP